MTVNRKQQGQGKSGHTDPPSVLRWLGVSGSNSCVFYVLLVVMVTSGLMVVRTTHENRFTFSELQQLRDEANQLEVEWGQLLLEQSTFGVEGRIEQKAMEQLQMQVPDIDDIVMVQHDQ